MIQDKALYAENGQNIILALVKDSNAALNHLDSSLWARNTATAYFSRYLPKMLVCGPAIARADLRVPSARRREVR